LKKEGPRLQSELQFLDEKEGPTPGSKEKQLAASPVLLRREKKQYIVTHHEEKGGW